MKTRQLARTIWLFAALLLLWSYLPARPTVSQAADFLPYVWTEVPASNPTNLPADLRQALVTEVNKMLAAGHLAPLHVVKGISAGQAPLPWGNKTTVQGAEWFWLNPGELVYTLSLAYPLLPPDTQTAVKSYLNGEMKQFPPVKQGAGCWVHPIYTNCLSQGARRELYDLPPIDGYYNAWPPPTPPVENLYSLWLYAKNTNDWTYITANWTDIQSVYSSYKSLGRTPSYGEIGGLIGMARLAKAQGNQSLADEAAGLAAQGMNAGLNFDLFVQNAGALAGSYHNPAVNVFLNLTPEVARYLSDNLQSKVKAYVDDLTSPRKMPGWYGARVEQQMGGENEFYSPDISWSIFLAKSYVLGESQQALRRYLDIPWSVGDLYYLQKLIATSRASGQYFSTFLAPLIK